MIVEEEDETKIYLWLLRHRNFKNCCKEQNTSENGLVWPKHNPFDLNIILDPKKEIIEVCENVYKLLTRVGIKFYWMIEAQGA